MGRYLKNTAIDTPSSAIRLPIGSSSVRPDAPVDGQIRFNTSLSKIEMYFNGVWNSVAKIGTVDIVQDTFTTVSGTTSYGPMSYAYSAGQESSVMVYVGGVQQIPGTNYQFQGDTTILLNPTNGTSGQTITILHNFNSTDAV
jgi:hypothetical protein